VLKLLSLSVTHFRARAFTLGTVPLRMLSKDSAPAVPSPIRQPLEAHWPIPFRSAGSRFPTVKFAEFQGIVKFWWHQWRRQDMTLIEYK
jgi:hypothetical protein